MYFTWMGRLTDVERVSLLFGNPVFVDHNQFLDELRQGVSIKGLLFSWDTANSIRLAYGQSQTGGTLLISSSITRDMRYLPCSS